MSNQQNKIDVAILGLGGMGQTHVEAAKDSPYVNKIYGYEPKSDRAILRGRELGIKSTSDLSEILNQILLKPQRLDLPLKFRNRKNEL